MSSKNLHNNLQGYAFMAPALLVIGVFTLLPIVFAFLMMFCKVDLMAGSWKFIGLDNAGKIFSDVKFWHAFWNTTRYVIVVVPIQTILAMILDENPGSRPWYVTSNGAPFVISLGAAVQCGGTVWFKYGT